MAAPRHSRGRCRRWLLWLALLVIGRSFVQLRPEARVPPTLLRARPEKASKSSRSLVFLAVKDAIYTALFGAPYEAPNVDVTGTLSNFTSAAVSSATSSVKAVEGAAASATSWTLSKAQELGSLLHLGPGDANASAAASQTEAEEEVSMVPVLEEAEASTELLPPFQDGTGLGAEPGDFFLFIKDYGWTLRYRVSRQEDSVDTERPLLLDWIKLRRAVQKPSELLEIPSSDLFEWDVVEPPRHSGFMYQVTEVVGSGVEAVINFFKDRGPKLLVQQDGVSLVNEEADAPGKPVTHCWVQCFGLPFLPVLQYIAFLNHDEIVTDWRA